MKVKELLYSRTKEDILEIAKHLSEEYPEYYKDTEKGYEHFLYFIAQCKKCETGILPEDLKDFLIVCKQYKDDLESGITFLDEAKTQIDFDKLQDYFNVDGLHLHELIERRKTLDMTLDELRNYEGDTFNTYGIDFMDRCDILECEILQLSIDTYGKNIVAAEIFWEMTFYGLEEDGAQEKKAEVDEILEDIKARGEDAFVKSEPITIDEDLIPTDADMKNVYKICDWNCDNISKFFNKYLDDYKDSQVNEILGR